MNKDIKFLLINPTSPLWRVEGKQRPKNGSAFRFSMLPSLYVAASLPQNVHTHILDEEVEPLDFNTDADLIGISFMTYNAPRAYELGDYFKSKGKKVIFGGYHPTFMPEEAIEHCDAVCIGEAENNMPHIIEDFQRGELKPFYKNELMDLAKLPKLNRGLLRKKSYITVNTMQATRGCYYHCDFCSIAVFTRNTFRVRPIADVIDEMKGLGRHILFMDDNLTLDPEYAKELFRQMKPLNKLWYSQSGISIGEDEELLRLAAESGCRGLFIGFESLSEDTLKDYRKVCNRRKDYLDLVNKIHKAGISIFAGFVFGGDEDHPDVFEDTLDFLLDSNIEVIQSTRLTPFPGTPLFNKMKSEGRILDFDWSHYDFFHVVHQPRNMDMETLHYGTAWLQKQFFSYKNIVRRLARSSRYLSPEVMLKAVAPLNFGYRIKLGGYGTFKLGKRFNPANYKALQLT